jgi:hypothetical protein
LTCTSAACNLACMMRSKCIQTEKVTIQTVEVALYRNRDCLRPTLTTFNSLFARPRRQPVPPLGSFSRTSTHRRSWQAKRYANGANCYRQLQGAGVRISRFLVHRAVHLQEGQRLCHCTGTCQTPSTFRASHPLSRSPRLHIDLSTNIRLHQVFFSPRANGSLRSPRIIRSSSKVRYGVDTPRLL